MATSRLNQQIIDRLLKHNLLTSAQVQEIYSKNIQFLEDLKREALQEYNIDRQDFLHILAEHGEMPVISLQHYTPTEEDLKLLPAESMIKHRAVAISHTETTLTLALANPTDIMAQQHVATITNRMVVPVAVDEAAIDEILQQVHARSRTGLDDIIDEEEEFELSDSDDNVDISDAADGADDAYVIKIVNTILREALRKDASDIHIEPFEHEVRLRYRVDGLMYRETSPPKSVQAAISSRMKVMSGLDISERRKPQDGKFRIKANGQAIDFRVSILPTVHGEKIVLRACDASNLRSGLDDLGLDPDALVKLQQAVSNPHGLVLVTGPTGSGKTTTLYSCLQELNDDIRNIVTVENPVEYQVYGINQVEINDKTGMTFNAALRSILRQDPDIVLVGETRDAETAEIAVKAALTGHLVFTTLHTNSAPGAITRLADMGVEPFLLSSSLVLSQAQRLVRTICPNCKVPIEPDWESWKNSGVPVELFEGVTIYEGRGCAKCNGSGYKGRASIMEVLMITPTIRQMIQDGATSDDIAEAAIEEQDFRDLTRAGYQRVIEGICTVEEVLRVSGGGH